MNKKKKNGPLLLDISNTVKLPPLDPSTSLLKDKLKKSKKNVLNKRTMFNKPLLNRWLKIRKKLTDRKKNKKMLMLNSMKSLLIWRKNLPKNPKKEETWSMKPKKSKNKPKNSKKKENVWKKCWETENKKNPTRNKSKLKPLKKIKKNLSSKKPPKLLSKLNKKNLKN